MIKSVLLAADPMTELDSVYMGESSYPGGYDVIMKPPSTSDILSYWCVIRRRRKCLNDIT